MAEIGIENTYTNTAEASSYKRFGDLALQATVCIISGVLAIRSSLTNRASTDYESLARDAYRNHMPMLFSNNKVNFIEPLDNLDNNDWIKNRMATLQNARLAAHRGTNLAVHRAAAIRAERNFKAQEIATNIFSLFS